MQKSSPSNGLSRPSLLTNYKKTILPNGIRIVTEEIPYVRSVSVGVWIDVGSRYENEKNNGITHFIEHMVFKGTERFSNQQIARSLESVGGYLNAFTTKEHTCFYARILDEHLKTAIDVISDLVQRPILNTKEIEKEKLVVLEELKNIEDNPDDIIHDYLDKNIFYKHPIGFPIIGRAESIRQYSRYSLLDYIHKYFVPKRLVIAAAGNLKHEKLVMLIDKYFKSNGKSKHPFERSQVPHRVHAGKEVMEKPINQAHICMGTLGYGVKSQMRYPLLVLNTLLGEGMSSRLFQNIRERYGFAYSIYSFTNLLSDTGSFGIYVGTDNNHIERSIDLIYTELERLKSKSVSRAELKRTKEQIKGNMMLVLENMSNRMLRLGSGELYYGKNITFDEVLRSIDAVNQEVIMEAANKIFRIEKFSTVIFKSKNGHAQQSPSPNRVL
ncbi:MAG: pitrilysin family protein [Bacteroidota bacterium]|nr:pitrilysin family protein [Bacteroidota bacterium]